MRHTAITTSPFSCQWIQRGSEGSIEGFRYAICQRIRDAERVVSEVECAQCPFWEPPLSGVSARATIVPVTAIRVSSTFPAPRTVLPV